MANKLLINKSYIEIQCDKADTGSQTKALSIPYIHYNRTRTTFRTTVRNIDVVLKLFRDIDEANIMSAPESIRVFYNAEMQRRRDTEDLLSLGPRKSSGWRYAHQQLGRELAEINNRYGFFYDTRTGKTPMSLSIIVDDIEKNPSHKWLVLCPLILIENAWLPDAKTFFPNLKVVSLHADTKKKRLEAFQQNAQLYISNIESFISYKEHIDKLNIYGCFVDESSTMKSHKAKFSEAAVEYSKTVNKWYLLSGVPAPNCDAEYYKQIQSIDYYGIHDSWTKFKMYFFNNVSYNPMYEKLEMKPERRFEFLTLLKKYSIYVDKEQVLTTPGRDFILVDIHMPKELKEKYDALKNDLCMELQGVDITATGAATVINKLNQVSSGFIIDTEATNRNKVRRANKINEPEEPESYFLSDYRFVELEKLLKNIGDEQVLIWAIYRKEFEIIKQRLGNKCACVYGATDINEKNKNIKDFKEGKIQYLVANPASADKGLTLTNAHFAIYFSIGYSMELFKQSAERIYGSVNSQPKKCTYYILAAVGTVDKIIYNAVQNKVDISMEVLEHLKGGI